MKNIYAVYFDTPIDKCKERIQNRDDHVTNTVSGVKIDDKMFDYFKNSLQMPNLNEGFSGIFTISSQKDFDSTMSQLQEK